MIIKCHLLIYANKQAYGCVLSDFEKEKNWKSDVDYYGVNLSNIAL